MPIYPKISDWTFKTVLLYGELIWGGGGQVSKGSGGTGLDLA